MTNVATRPSSLQTTMQLSLGVLRRRLLLIGLGIATAWSTAAAVGVLIVGAWLDLAVDFNGPVRVMIDLAALAALIVVAFRLQKHAMRSASKAAMARTLDVAAARGGKSSPGWISPRRRSVMHAPSPEGSPASRCAMPLP